MSLNYQIIPCGNARVAFCHLPHVQSISVGLWFNVGARYETEQESGVFHFIEHMLFKGTKRRSAKMISELIEGHGGDINAFTSQENTCYYARIASRHLPLVMDVLFGMVCEPLFLPDEVEKERGVIEEEIRMYDDQPGAVASDVLDALIWPKHPLGRSVAGTLETVGRMNRSTILDYWKRHYTPNRLVISVAGNADLSTLLKLVQKNLTAAKCGKTKPNPNLKVKIAPSRAVSFQAIARPFKQAQLAIGFDALSKHDSRRYALRLLNVALGENMSSRLFQVLRERHGWAYSVQSAMSCLEDTGGLFVHVGLDKENVPKALQTIGKELNRLKEKQLSPKELKRAKDYAIGQFELSLEKPTSQMMRMGESLISYGKIDSPQVLIDALSRVSAQQIQTLAHDLIQPGKAHVVCVGPDIEDKWLKPAVTQFI